MIKHYLMIIYREIEFISSILFLPAAILHEGYHYFMAKALSIKIDKVGILSRDPNTPVNYVHITANSWWEAAAVTFAPFIFGAPLFLFATGFKEMYNAGINSIWWWTWFFVVMSIGAGSVDFIMTFVYLKNAILNKPGTIVD